ncbi:MAG: ankyrin repeat domain-containing protein [Proteobacteria bacterium]|nr:ankyrin repeat domain-containing protein [Pseudomonadota bacterium]
MLNANQLALVQALKAKDEAKILECIGKESDVNFSFMLIEERRVLTPLHRCVEDPKLVGAARELLRAGANKEALDDENRTPLISAAIKRCHDGVQLLLEWSANVHARDKYGCRAQEYASAPCDNPAMYQALQQRAAPTLFSTAALAATAADRSALPPVVQEQVNEKVQEFTAARETKVEAEQRFDRVLGQAQRLFEGMKM